MKSTIKKAFETTNREQLSFAELTSMGCKSSDIDRAVEAEELRKGSRGYWLPRAADPGALSVMRRQLRDNDNNEETES